MLIPHFSENIFHSGMTVVSSNDIITLKIDDKKVYKPPENKETKFFFFKWAVKWNEVRS